MKSLYITLAVVALALAAPDAAAQLSGHTLTADWWYPDQEQSIETHTIVVGAAIELTPETITNDDKFYIDLDDSTVTFKFNATSNWTATAFNGWRFVDADGTLPPIASYTIDSHSAGIINTGAIQLSSTADSFHANFAGMVALGADDYITLRVNFVPAPGAVAVLPLAALVAFRRRR